MNDEDKDAGNTSDQDFKQGSSSSRDSYGSLSIEISEEHLQEKGVQRLLLSDLKKLKIEKIELQKIEVKFHELDKENAVLKTKFAQNKFAEFLSKFCIGSGSAILGIGVKLYDWATPSKDNALSLLLIIIGIFLITGSLIISSKK